MKFPYTPLFFALLSIVSAGDRQDSKARMIKVQTYPSLIAAPPWTPVRGVVYYSRRKFWNGNIPKFQASDRKLRTMVVVLGPVVDENGKPLWGYTRVVEMSERLNMPEYESAPAWHFFPENQLLYFAGGGNVPLKSVKSRINISHVRVLPVQSKYISPTAVGDKMKVEEEKVREIEWNIEEYRRMAGEHTPRLGPLGRSKSI